MNAILKKEHLRDYYLVSEPGTFIVKVTNTVKPEYLYDEGSKARYLVNLKVGTQKGFEACLSKMGNREIINFSEVKDCFLTGAIWDNDLDDIQKLPTKGEKVIATFDYVEDILKCISITLIPRKELQTFDLDALDASRKLFKSLLTK